MAHMTITEYLPMDSSNSTSFTSGSPSSIKTSRAEARTWISGLYNWIMRRTGHDQLDHATELSNSHSALVSSPSSSKHQARNIHIEKKNRLTFPFGRNNTTTEKTTNGTTLNTHQNLQKDNEQVGSAPPNLTMVFNNSKQHDRGSLTLSRDATSDGATSTSTGSSVVYTKSLFDTSNAKRYKTPSTSSSFSSEFSVSTSTSSLPPAVMDANVTWHKRVLGLVESTDGNYSNESSSKTSQDKPLSKLPQPKLSFIFGRSKVLGNGAQTRELTSGNIASEEKKPCEFETPKADDVAHSVSTETLVNEPMPKKERSLFSGVRATREVPSGGGKPVSFKQRLLGSLLTRDVVDKTTESAALDSPALQHAKEPKTPAQLVGKKLWNRVEKKYQLGELLGEGAFGFVLAAISKSDDKEV